MGHCRFLLGPLLLASVCQADKELTFFMQRGSLKVETLQTLFAPVKSSLPAKVLFLFWGQHILLKDGMAKLIIFLCLVLNFSYLFAYILIQMT